MIIASLIIFVGIGWVFKFYLGQVIVANEKLISQSQKQLASQEYQDLNKQIISLNGAVLEIKNLNNKHFNWSNAMLQLSSLIQPAVQLNQLDFDATTGKVEILGQAKTRQDVIDLWSRKTPLFITVSMPRKINS
jgi:hypothetical protein